MTAAGRSPGPWGFRAPTDSRRIMTIDRRESVPVNALGRGETTTYDRLADHRRRRFDAQLAAWRAACNLAGVYTDSATYGIPVPDGNAGHLDPLDAWLTARRAWEKYR